MYAACVAVVVMFFANAWIADDAYIIFRSVEQLFSGNGPRWNPHERVQVYTSPAWYLLLCVVRIFSSKVYFTTIFLSFGCCVVAAHMLKKCLTAGAMALLLVSLLTSASFFDFTTSGLENPLCYLLVSLFIYCIFGNADLDVKTRISRLLLIAGFAPVVRHDLAVFIWPAAALICFTHRKEVGFAHILKWGAISLIPFCLWSAFSLIYYGLLFPNTAYAKLNTGYLRSDVWRAGMNYLHVSAKGDPLLAAMIFLGVPCFLVKGGYSRAICLGVVAHVLYVLSVGGDFMRGRFFSTGVLVMCFLTAHLLAKKENSGYLQLACAALLLVVNISTLTSPIRSLTVPLVERIIGMLNSGGVSDERATYTAENGLLNRITGAATNPDVLRTCNFTQCQEQSQLKQCVADDHSPGCTFVYGMIGKLGYLAGNNVKIIDYYALSDPLLAQLPVTRGAFTGPGHFSRKIPQGYIESVVSGENHIEDHNIRQLYEKMRLISESQDLLDHQRLKAIWELNTGKLRYLARGDYAGIDGLKAIQMTVPKHP